MTFDFDRVIDRRQGDSLKWNRYAQRDVIPMWVADMDFAAAPAIQAALQARVAEGVYGYGMPTAEMVSAVIQYHAQHHGWQIRPEWLVPLPGLVPGLNLVCRTMGKPGGKVVMATPVYHKFLSAPIHSDKERVVVPLHQVEGRWEWDWNALDQALAGADVLLLCNPHNPVGRVWTQDELRRVMTMCAQHQVVVCSDEVHCDLVLAPDCKHICYATLGDVAATHSITLLAPSKTWNLAGLGCALAVIPNEALRLRFTQGMQGIMPHVNILGYVAAAAAYRDGEAWRLALIDYLRANRDHLIAALDQFQGLTVSNCEATYLAWIDFRETGIIEPQRFLEAAGVGVSDGTEFGLPGFVRLNFGCPRSTLDEAIRRIKQALAIEPA
ncbi:PatB family C-S lyase [Chitinivorax sp. B]|uniref:MalY/PatB family protein n=1 Tax=Chitinivorax sp. B TaxID=2502235 RepID=UPI0010F94986|nr:PatB family C-S lyase [Chitinivorax sp. B]